MKKYIKTVIAVLISAAVWTACEQEQATVVAPTNFEVTPTASTFKVGDIARFDLKGDPDMILFYSGELGAKYENKDRIQAAGTPKLLFQTQMQQGRFSNGDTLELLIAPNLKATDSASFAGATWTNITNRNTKWARTLSTTFVVSDSINLADFNNAETVTLAFRAIGKKDTSVAQRKWAVQNLVVNNTLSDGTVTPVVNTFANTGWFQLSLKNFAHAWDVGTLNVSGASAAKNAQGGTIRTSYPITFEPTTIKGMDDNDDLLITSPINLKKIKPDAPLVIKNMTNATLTRYGYVFSKAGTYNVTFVAQNVRSNDRKEVVKQIQVTVQ